MKNMCDVLLTNFLFINDKIKIRKKKTFLLAWQQNFRQRLYQTTAYLKELHVSTFCKEKYS